MLRLARMVDEAERTHGASVERWNFWTKTVLPDTGVLPVPPPWPREGRDIHNDWVITTLGAQPHGGVGLHTDGRTAAADGRKTVQTTVPCSTIFAQVHGRSEMLVWERERDAVVRAHHRLPNGEIWAGGWDEYAPGYWPVARRCAALFDRVRAAAPGGGVRYIVLTPGQGVVLPVGCWHWVRALTPVTVKYSSSVVDPTVLLPPPPRRPAAGGAATARSSWLAPRPRRLSTAAAPLTTCGRCGHRTRAVHWCAPAPPAPRPRRGHGGDGDAAPPKRRKRHATGAP